ncbi:glycosyltransferase family 4 protein, partial [Desulfonauticus submarinus]
LKPGVSFFGQINFGIIKELYKNKYDAIIIHGWNHFTNILAVFAAKIFRVKVLLRGENPLNQEFLKLKWKIIFKKIFFRPFLKLIDAFLYIGEENKDFYKFYGAEESKLFFTPYAIETKRFIAKHQQLKTKKSELKNSLGIGKNDLIILFVGKLIDKKRPMDLLKAYRLIDSKNKALIFVGEGKLRKEMEEFIKQNNLKNVIITGFINQSEISKYYAIVDIFVLPSGLGETWGLVVNEAMCFELPVIVSNVVGCSKDLVRENKNGFIFPLENYRVLAEKIKLLLVDDNKREKFGKKSFEIISREYTLEKDVQGVLNALKYLEIEK